MRANDEDIVFFVQWLDKYEHVLPIIANEVGAKEDEYLELTRHILRAKEIYLSLKAKPRLWTEDGT